MRRLLYQFTCESVIDDYAQMVKEAANKNYTTPFLFSHGIGAEVLNDYLRLFLIFLLTIAFTFF